MSNFVQALAAADYRRQNEGWLNVNAPLPVKHVNTADDLCDPGDEHSETKCIGSGCKSTWCETCSRAKGLEVRNKLKFALTKPTALWESQRPVMLTLTFDQNREGHAKQWESPKECFDYMRKQGMVSRLMRDLNRRGHVNEGRYFWVLEFHKNGWPHIHVVVDSDFIPVETVARSWNRLGPDGHTGFVFVTKGRDSKTGEFCSLEHAINYAIKYVTKRPRDGFPDWIYEHKGIFKRWGHSHGLINDEAAKAKREEKAARLEAAKKSGKYKEPERPLKYGRVAETVGGRVASCGTRCVIVRRHRRVSRDGTIIERSRFVGAMSIPLIQVADFLGRELESASLSVTQRDVVSLMNFAEETGRAARLSKRYSELKGKAYQQILFEIFEPPALPQQTNRDVNYD